MAAGVTSDGVNPPESPGQPALPLPPFRKEYKKVHLPTAEELYQQDVMDNCAVRTVISGVFGGGLGALAGIVFGSMDGGGAGMDGNMAGAKTQTVREVVKQMVMTARSRSWTYAKGFAIMGALFAGSECVIEKMRARHDGYNSMYAGCVTGGIIAHSAGPKGMCLGCLSFGAFSALIDRIMDH